MAKSPKEKLNMHVQLHSLSVLFEQNTVHKLSSFPPLYIRLSRGSQSVESAHITLVESSPGSSTYTAHWDQVETLQLSLGITRDLESGEFGSKHLKFLLKIFSEGKSSHRTLASYTFDVASLNLSCLDIIPFSKEKQTLECSVGKNATSVISSVTLDVTFHYSLMHDQFAYSLEASTSDIPLDSNTK